MNLKYISQLSPRELSEQTVLLRLDLDCPVVDDKIVDDRKLSASIASIDFLVNSGAHVVVLAHFGPVTGRANSDFSLRPIAEALQTMLRKQRSDFKVDFCAQPRGAELKEKIKQTAASNNSLLMLENLAFELDELNNDPHFAKELASYGHIFVQDAFSVVNRNYASVVGVSKHLPSYAGLLIESEINTMSNLLQKPKSPFVAIVGGQKINQKLGLLESLLKKANFMLIGGAIAYTFLRAKDVYVGDSPVESDYLGDSFSMLNRAQDMGAKIELPLDHLISGDDTGKGKTKTVAANGLLEDWIAVDIGSKTMVRHKELIKKAAVIFWSGPMGIYEIAKFAKGTENVAKMLSKSKAKIIISGTDTLQAINKYAPDLRIDLVSFGGGCALEFLIGRRLAGFLPMALEDD